MNEQFNTLITKAAWVALSLLGIRCLISWNSLLIDFSFYGILGYASEAIGATVLFMGFYEKLLWKYDPFEDTPVLKRCYKGTLTSTFDGIEREANLKIKQTLLSINIILTSGESSSRSISSTIENVLGEKQLTYCYINMPKASFRHKSEIHYGTAIVCIEDPNRLTGHYFSDRKTTGDMVFYTKESLPNVSNTKESKVDIV